MVSLALIEELWRSKQCSRLMREVSTESVSSMPLEDQGRACLLMGAAALWLGEMTELASWLEQASSSASVREQAFQLRHLTRGEAALGMPKLAGVNHDTLIQRVVQAGSVKSASREMTRAVIELVVEPLDAGRWRHVGDQIEEVDFEGALEIYRRAMELAPDSAEIVMEVAKFTRKVDPGRMHEALALFQRSAELGPDDVYVHLYIGNTLWELGRMEEAEQAYRRAAEVDSAEVDGVGFYGDFLIEMDRFDEGLALLDKAKRNEPEGWWTFRYGWGLYRSGQYALAAEWLSRALVLDPDCEQARVYLSVVKKLMSSSE